MKFLGQIWIVLNRLPPCHLYLFIYFCIFNLLNFFFKRKIQDYFLFLDKELSQFDPSLPFVPLCWSILM